MIPMKCRTRSTGTSAAPRAARAAAALLLAVAASACSRRPDEPVLSLLGKTLKRGDRVVLLRTLDPEGTRVGMVVDTTAGKPELRIYERRGTRDYALVHTAQQGDAFRNLSLEDVDGDGKDEIVVTWEGGHLEMVEVIAPGEGHAYHSIFQNAGRQVEKRYSPAGQIEFWITSRTYDERPGEAPAYATTVYRFENGKYTETTKK
jgi:hypothetical protein